MICRVNSISNLSLYYITEFHNSPMSFNESKENNLKNVEDGEKLFFMIFWNNMIPHIVQLEELQWSLDSEHKKEESKCRLYGC